MTKLTLIGLALAAALALGCGPTHKHEQVDAAPQPAQDAGTPEDAPVGCGFAPTYASLPFVATDVGSNSSNDPGQYIFFDGFLTEAARPDLLEIELMAGYGAFVDGIRTGTFKITGDEANYGTCGLCVRLLSQVDPATWEADQYYMAVSGTVTVSSVEGELRGTLNNVLFEHVTIDTQTLLSTSFGDGCTSKAKQAAFEAEMEAPDGGWPMDDVDGGMPDGMHM